MWVWHSATLRLYNLAHIKLLRDRWDSLLRPTIDGNREEDAGGADAADRPAIHPVCPLGPSSSAPPSRRRRVAAAQAALASGGCIHRLFSFHYASVAAASQQSKI